MAISPISSVNKNIRNLSFGENQENTGAENKPKMSTQTKALIGAGLAALAAVGIYIATRGKTKVKPNVNNPIPASQQKLTDEQLIDFNAENKKFFAKVQEKIKTEWEQLKNLEDGKYVKKDGKYVPATENDLDYIDVRHMSEGLSYNSIAQYKNGKYKRTFIIDNIDALDSYQSNDGRVVLRCFVGDDLVSTNLKKSQNSLAFDVARAYGKNYFNSLYVK